MSRRAGCVAVGRACKIPRDFERIGFGLLAALTVDEDSRMRWQRLSIPLTVGLIAAGSLLQVARSDEIDDYVNAEMQARHIPGVSLAVIKEGKVVKAQGYGLANVELKVPAGPETVYKIGSVSKQFI